MRVLGVFLITVSMVVTCASTTDSQASDGAIKGNRIITQESYGKVLDLVFPRDETTRNYLLVLRFGPSFHSESQIVIKGGGDKVEVLEYTSLSGNIYDRLNNFVARGSKEDVVELAKLIKVRRRAIEVPYAQAKQWQAGFLDGFEELSKSFKEQTEQLDKDSSINVVLDGTLYEIWYSQGVSKTSFRVWDEEVSERQPNGRLKVVQWMNAVRHDVEKLK